jgi:streptogramin lyase
MGGVSVVRISVGIVSLAGALFLAGCSGFVTTPSGGVEGAAIRGTVHGGQNPIVGAHVYLYAANTTGYGSASISVLGNHPGSTTVDGSSHYYVTTDANGDFAITGDYTCPAAISQVYLYAVGGSSSGSGSNSGAGLLAALGTCPASGTLSSSLFVDMNEVSTVAMAYAVSGYATDATHVSSPNTPLALRFIANAFGTVQNLETLSTGVANTNTAGGNGAVPQQEINSLADILAACINTTAPTSSGCSTLFSNAQNGSTTPTDTATAAINIAHNPTLNVPTLYGLIPLTGAPFQPTLAGAPNDFSLAINYTGGGLNYPAVIAVDAYGNVWTANFQNNSVSEFNPYAIPLSTASGFTGGGLNGPFGMAIDSTNNVWVVNNTGSVLSEFDPSGNPVSSTGYTGGGLTLSLWLTIDSTGNLWMGNDPGTSGAPLPGSLSEFSSAGAPKSPITVGYTTGGVNRPEIGAVDTSGNIWFTNQAGNSLTEYTTATGVANGSSPYSPAGLNEPVGIAIDPSGNMWVSNYGNNTLSKLTSSGSAVSYYSGGGLGVPEGVAVDGAGNIWVANYGSDCLSEFDSNGNAISTSSGFQAYMNEPDWLAIDGSGNIWVANKGDVYITQFVGLAAPVATPVVANLLSPYGTHAVNKP